MKKKASKTKPKYQSGMVSLLNGTQVPVVPEIVELQAPRTRCPAKWLLVDLEMGQAYCWNDAGGLKIKF